MGMKETTAGPGFEAWFALADAEYCRFMNCNVTKQGTRHVHEHDSITNAFPEQQHGLPLIGAGEAHQTGDNERHFAGEIIGWLQAKASQHEIELLTIFAPPRMLEVLATIPLGSLEGHVHELKGDLMRLTCGQLADHWVVRELMVLHLHPGFTE